MRKILIFGGNGMLGHKLAQKFRENFEVSATLRGESGEFSRSDIFRGVELVPHVRIEDEAAVEKAIAAVGPDVVVNAVGVVKQLPQSKDVIRTLTINSIFPHRLAELSGRYRFRLINISTDCVFDGKKGNYTEADQPNATDLYGKSKNLGEVEKENCLTLRTSIIGRELGTRHSLVEWFLSNRGKRVKGYLKAIYTGFPTVVLAGILEDLIVRHPDLQGIFHVSSEKINKFELLEMINREFEAEIEIEPDEDFALDRSLDSRKFREATGFVPESWEGMIKAMAEDAKIYEEYKK